MSSWTLTCTNYAADCFTFMQSYFYFIQYYYTAYEITLEVKKKTFQCITSEGLARRLSSLECFHRPTLC